MKFRILAESIVVVFLFGLTPQLTWANPPQWQEQITAAVESVLSQWQDEAQASDETLEWTISSLDPRLLFEPCGNPPEATSRSAAKSGRLTFAVQCAGPKPWQLFISVEVDRYALVAVTSTPIARNSVLQPSQIEYKRLNTGDLNYGYYKQGVPVLGQVSKRALPAGFALNPGVLEPPKVVAKGDHVIISATSAVMVVRMNGVALSDGRLGEQIPVENTSSQRRIKATVTGQAQVEVPM